MNQSKFSLADLLTLLIALVFSFVCFLSTIFFTLGSISQSIILSAIIFLLLAGTALGAKLLKRTSGNFKPCFILEVSLLLLFTGLTLFFLYSTFAHYFVVSSQKELIQSKLANSISQAEKMFDEYEKYAENRENLYKTKLSSVVYAKRINPSEFVEFGFLENEIAVEKQIENKMFTVHADLFPTNYSDTISNNGIKEVAKDWLSASKNKITKWKPGIVGVVTDIEQNSNEWLNRLIELSTVREKGEIAVDFEYNLAFDDVKKHFTTLGQPTSLSLLLAVVAYLLMLMSYFITKRHTKWPGLKEIFSRENKIGNSTRKIITN